MNKVSLVSRIISTESYPWKTFQYFQQDSFKDLTSEAKAKLKKSVLENGFSQPFYVWYDPFSKETYCLDGRHRTRILEELILEGVEVPELLPTTFMTCKNRKEAASLVLTYSSMYAKVNAVGLFDFIQLYEIDWSGFSSQIDLPGFDNNRFTGDIDRDFSIQNTELDLSEFSDETILKLTFSKNHYLQVKKKFESLMGSKRLDSPEAVIINLLEIE